MLRLGRVTATCAHRVTEKVWHHACGIEQKAKDTIDRQQYEQFLSP